MYVAVCGVFPYCREWYPPVEDALRVELSGSVAKKWMKRGMGIGLFGKELNVFIVNKKLSYCKCVNS